MRRKISLLVIVCISLSLMGWTQLRQTLTIRVGVYENAPKIYTSGDGSVSGFWPNIIYSIAEQERWKIVWVHGTWEECLERLELNEIDIMPDTGWSEERSKKFAFSTETVLISWARVYVPEGSTIETILDLEGKKVAGLKGGLNFDGAEGIKELTKNFGVQSTFIEKSSYTDVFKALENNEVDAGVTNKDFGDLNEQNYKVNRTPIIIQPTHIRFAFTKNAELTPYLINAVDTHLRVLKSDSDSLYYRALDQYLGEKPIQTIVEILPAWFNTLLMAGGGIFLFLLAVSITSRIQVQRQTAELQISESRNRALIENIPDLLFRINKDGMILDYHSAIEDDLYTSPRKFMGENICDVLPKELAHAILDKVKCTIESREIQSYEYQMPINGKDKDFEARFTASGEDEVIAIIRDITSPKQAEKELRESEERYQTLAKVSPVGIFRTDKTGYTTYVNPTWSQISGLSTDEALGDGWLKAVHPEDREGLSHNWQEAARHQKASRADYRFIRTDGTIIWVIGQAVPEINSENQIVGYVGTITDITERKRVEAALQHSIASERATHAVAEVIQAANLALTRSLDLDVVLEVLLDFLGKIIPFDSANIMLLEDEYQLIVRATRGYKSKTDTVQTHAMLFDVRNNSIIKSIVDEKKYISIDDTRQYPGWERPAGTEHVVSWMGVPLIAGGQVLGLYSLDKTTPGFFTQEFRELAEALAAQAAIAIQNAKLLKELQRHAAELEQRVAERTAELAKRVSEVETLNSTMLSLMKDLQAAVKKAESADRLKSAFLATMSHELRTPLNSIIGFTGILLQKMVGPLSEEQEKQLKMVQGSARHLLELINDVLDISKIEADQIEIHDELFDMGTVIQKSVEKIMPMAEKKDLTLTVEVTPEVIEINSDRRRVEQILLNLLNNAVKFTEHGGIQIESHIENDWLMTRLSDTGIGIKREDLQSLFIPFRQIDTGITRQYEGTGLGLSICKRLIELMGGDIWVESEPEKGSTFTFTLPLQRIRQ